MTRRGLHISGGVPSRERGPVLRRRPLLGGMLASAALRPTKLIAGQMPANVRLARDLRNNWGVCTGLPDSAEDMAAALRYLNTRWIRGNYIVDAGKWHAGALTAVSTVLGQTGAAQPRLSVQCLIFAYMNDLALTWSANQVQLLHLRASGVLAAVEGPNEMNSPWVGSGSHGPTDTDNGADPRYGGGGDGTWLAKFEQWVAAMATFRQANATALAGVELIAPTVAVAPPGGNCADYFDQLPNVGGILDYGTAHYYAGGGHSDNLGYAPGADGSANGNFYNTYVHTERAEGAPLVLSECGAATDGTSYARDGLSQCRYLLNQFFDLFAMGGHRVFFYELFDGTGTAGDYEGNFGLFAVDEATPKPAAMALANLSNLLSLGNAWSNSANATDTAAFTPAYVGTGLTISGMADASVSGQCLVLPKSDQTTMVAVWNEPDPLDPYTAAAVPVTLNLGSLHNWRLHDPTGSTGSTLAPALSTAPVAVGSGSSVPLTLRGYPMIVELIS